MRSDLHTPTSLWGPMRLRYHQPLKVVRFVQNFLLICQPNVSHADIPCVLENVVGEAARPTQLITLYITVNITPQNLYNRPSTKVDDSPAEDTIPERILFPAPEHFSSPSHRQPVESGNTISQSREEMLPIRTRNPRFALHLADKVMKRIVRNDQSNTWEGAVGRIKWVMDTLGPIAEVRVINF